RQAAGVQRHDQPDAAVAALETAFSRFDGVADPFALLLGLPAPRLEQLEPEATRRRLHAAVATWLRALADETPLVLAVGDVHGADASSCALVAELAGLTEHARISLVLSGRPEARKLLVELGRDETNELILEALADAETAELVAAMLGSSPPSELTAFVAER